MPKARRAETSDLDNRLADIVSSHLNELVNAVANEVRRNVANEIRDYLSGVRPGPLPSVNGRRLLSGGTKAKRIIQCIAPGCNNASKGPRFHYLCDKHRDAPKKDYEAWRKAKQERAAGK